MGEENLLLSKEFSQRNGDGAGMHTAGWEERAGSTGAASGWTANVRPPLMGKLGNGPLYTAHGRKKNEDRKMKNA